MPSKETTASRSACERCRAQKLKCQRSIQGQMQCDRCAKAALQCCTYPMLPTGRPRLKRIGRSTNQPFRTLSLLQELFPEQADLNAVAPQALTISNSQFDASTTLPSAGNPNSTSCTFASVPDKNFLTQPTSEDDGNTPPVLGHDDLDYEQPITINNNIFPLWQFEDLVGPFGQGSATDSPLPVALPRKNTDKRSHYLDKLTTFNSNLARQVSKYSDATSINSNSQEGMAEPSMPAVGQLLQSAHDLTEILTHFLLTVPLTSAPRLQAGNTVSDSEEDVEFEDPPARSSPQSSTSYSTTVEDEDYIASSQQDTNKSLIDYPTVLALATAYVSLVRLHRLWFQKILNALKTASARQKRYFNSWGHCHYMLQGYSRTFEASPDLPAVLPDLSLDGFQLSQSRTLQIMVASDISLTLLWRAERSVASLAASSQGGTGSGNLELLRMMLAQEVATSSGSIASTSECFGWKSLTILAKEIKRETQRNVCLQLEEALDRSIY